MKLGKGIQASGQMTVCALIIFLLSASTAYGQRTMDGQDNISVSAHYTHSGGFPLGASLWWGRYLLCCNAKAGLSYSPSSHEISSHTQSVSRAIQVYTILAQGEYMHRIVSDRGRHIGLYAGGGVFLGCELYDPFGTLPGHIETGLADSGFLYGICPAVELEAFIGRRVCILARFAVPVNFSSPFSRIRYETGIGARFNL